MVGRLRDTPLLPIHCHLFGRALDLIDVESHDFSLGTPLVLEDDSRARFGLLLWPAERQDKSTVRRIEFLHRRNGPW